MAKAKAKMARQTALGSAAPARTKIAIVGGGPAGLSAAFHLTRDPAWREKYEITVYQLGWRVGGKGATGRDATRHQRLEEHGIHGFCNFYFNTFAMIRDVYGALDPADRALLPTRQMSDAFHGSSRTFAIAALPTVWRGVLDWLPSTLGDPWDPDWVPDLSWKSVVKGVLLQLAWRGRSDEEIANPDASDLVRADYEPAVQAAANALHGTIWRVWQEQAGVAPELPGDLIDARLRAWIADLDAQRQAFGVLAAAAAGLAFPPTPGAPPVRPPNPTALRALSVLDLYWTLLRGLIADRLLLPDAELDAIDATDYREWLVGHGLSDLVKMSPILNSVANILFAYPNGDTSASPRLSAASWASWMLRSVIGRGAYFYFMGAGTGESVILPLYLSLARAGVRFEFFHKLVGAKSSGGKSPRITELHFRRQARVKNDRAYEPLVKVQPPGKRAFLAWPNQPNLAQLRDASALRGADLEAWESQPGERPRKLELRRDFDEVVWAVPPTITALVSDAGMKKTWTFPRQLGTTATQAAQIWLKQSTKDLGWNPLENATAPTVRKTERYACSSYPQPLNAFVVFDDLIEYEAWPVDDSPHGLIYLCAQLQELAPASERSRSRDEIRVATATSGAVRLLGKLLPKASAAPGDPYSLRFELLHVPGAGGASARGEERLRAQYYRANTRPTEAYVQANPGTAAARCFAWESGFANAVLAGDWTYTGMNIGAFESAITGGKLAAFALTGSAAALPSLRGFTFLHSRAHTKISQALASGVIPRLK